MMRNTHVMKSSSIFRARERLMPTRGNISLTYAVQGHPEYNFWTLLLLLSHGCHVYEHRMFRINRRSRMRNHFLDTLRRNFRKP